MIQTQAAILCALLLLTSGFIHAQTEDPDASRFAAEIDSFANWDSKNSTPADAILFVGSSSIRRWPTADAFPTHTLVNRGFGGAHISDINHYYEQVVKPYSPATIVFYAGDNDIGGGKSPQRVLEDFQSFTGKVRADLPDTEILFLSIKPSLARWQHWPTMEQANELIANYIATQSRMRFVDMASTLLGPDGQPKSVFIADGLHLNDAGNRLWQAALLPYLPSQSPHR